MDLSNLSLLDHLIVNRAEIVSGGCRACGRSFGLDLAGERVLSVAVGPDSMTCVFCAACGETITRHLQSDSVRPRYEWDWAVPLSGNLPEIPGEGAAEKAAAAQISNGTGFPAFSTTYDSERAAIINFLSKVRASETNGRDAFSAWAAVCTTESLKTGIRMIAEREASHARIFAQRLADLGAATLDAAPEEGRRFIEYLGNPQISDREKLRSFTRSVGDPAKSVEPIRRFVALITEDVQTREALLLFLEDELSSATWAGKACAELNQPTDSGT
jgi:hypothetical protein